MKLSCGPKLSGVKIERRMLPRTPVAWDPIQGELTEAVRFLQ